MITSYEQWQLQEAEETEQLSTLYDAIDTAVTKLFSQINDRMARIKASPMQKQTVFTHTLNKMLEISGLALDIPNIGQIKRISSGPRSETPGNDDWDTRFAYGKRLYNQMMQQQIPAPEAKQRLRDELARKYPSFTNNAKTQASLTSTVHAIIQDVDNVEQPEMKAAAQRVKPVTSDKSATVKPTTSNDADGSKEFFRRILGGRRSTEQIRQDMNGKIDRAISAGNGYVLVRGLDPSLEPPLALKVMAYRDALRQRGYQVTRTEKMADHPSTPNGIVRIHFSQ